MDVPGNGIRISVIVVGYNSRADLEYCLPALQDSCAPDVEIILVDNASADHTIEWAQHTFPSVNTLRSEINLGFGRGGNLGASAAQGEYLAFLNPDTTVERNWLAPLITALENDTRAGMVTSKILLLDQPDRINACGNDIHLSGLTLCRGVNQPRQNFSNAEEVSAISGAAFAIRRKVFDQLGGFDENFFMYMEDADLSMRAHMLGYRILFAPESVVNHNYALRFGPQKTFYQERNRYLMLLKTLQWRTLVALIPVFLLAELAAWGFVLWREPEKLGNKLRAYEWIVQHWDHILLQRRAMQSKRRVSDRALLINLKTRLDFRQTADGFVARLADWGFNPLFSLFGKIARWMATS
jgi:hypothetical protein